RVTVWILLLPSLAMHIFSLAVSMKRFEFPAGDRREPGPALAALGARILLCAYGPACAGTRCPRTSAAADSLFDPDAYTLARPGAPRAFPVGPAAGDGRNGMTEGDAHNDPLYRAAFAVEKQAKLAAEM